MKRIAGWAAVALIGGLPSAARAQDALPGGWSPRVVHRELGPVSIAALDPRGGPVTPYGAYVPGAAPRPTPPPASARARTANMLVPLGGIVRRSGRTRRGR